MLWLAIPFNGITCYEFLHVIFGKFTNRGRDNAQRGDDRFAALKEDDGPRRDRKGDGKGAWCRRNS